jgi:hypothetical protein
MRWLLCFAFFATFAASAEATPITIAGFTFSAGEQAFADNACTAGPVTPATSVANALSGSDIRQCVNTGDSTGGIVEVQFVDNAVVNDLGSDLVIFELSGPQSPGTPDSRERFGVSEFSGGSFSAFIDFDPVATGYNSGTDPTLDIFAAQVDLGAFGVAPGDSTDRFRLHIRNNNLGTKSADIAALGALTSGTPVPEPLTALNLTLGLLGQ